jgi:sec-independent protein translocase protein TatB
MMKRVNFSETIFLFFLALIIFGPKRLPEIARTVGKWMNELRRASNEFKAQIEQEIAHLEIEERKKTILPPRPTPEGAASRTLNAAPLDPSQTTPYSAYAGSGGPPSGEAAPAGASDDEPLFAMASPAAAAPAATPAVEQVKSAEAAPAAKAVPATISEETHA